MHAKIWPSFRSITFTFLEPMSIPAVIVFVNSYLPLDFLRGHMLERLNKWSGGAGQRV